MDVTNQIILELWLLHKLLLEIFEKNCKKGKVFARFKTHVLVSHQLVVVWTKMRSTRWIDVPSMWEHMEFLSFKFVIVNFLHNDSGKLFVIVSFFILTIAVWLQELSCEGV
jgi:hypothetical protein